MKISLSKIILSIFVAFVIYLALKWNISVNQIKEACNNAKLNKEISEVTSALNDSWLLRYNNFQSNDKKNIILIHSGANFGRYTCRIEHEREKVIKTEFTFLD